MVLELLAIDLGKRSFHLYGIDGDGVILSRKVSRARLPSWSSHNKATRDGSAAKPSITAPKLNSAGVFQRKPARNSSYLSIAFTVMSRTRLYKMIITQFVFCGTNIMCSRAFRPACRIFGGARLRPLTLRFRFNGNYARAGCGRSLLGQNFGLLVKVSYAGRLNCAGSIR